MAPRSNQAAIMRDALGNRLCSAAFSISGDVDAVQVRVSFRMAAKADNSRRNYLEPAVVSLMATYQRLPLIRGAQLLQGKGWPEGSIRGAVSLGHLHAYQTISEVQATSIAPKNK